MTRMFAASALVIAMAGAALMAAQQTAPARGDAARLEAAINRELIDGDLGAATEAYRQLAGSGDRAVAARALSRLAAAQLKLQKPDDAAATLQRVVDGFADQPQVAAGARKQLAALGRSSGSANSGQASTARAIAYRQVATFGPADQVGGNKVSFDGLYVPVIRWSEGALYVRDLRTGADRRVTRQPVIEKVDGYPDNAVLSRDSAHVAYSWFESAAPDGQRQQLRVVDLNEPGVPQPRVLYSNPEVDWIGPNDWSPDGSWIAVTVVRKDRSLQLGAVDVRGGTLRVLRSFTDWRSLTDALISPDGRYVAYDVVPQGTLARDVAVLSVDGSREVALVSGSSDDLPIAWAPDGALIFTSDRSGTPSVWMQGFDGRNPSGAPKLLYNGAGYVSWAGLTSAGAIFAVPPTEARHTTLKMVSADLANGQLLEGPVDVPVESGGQLDSAEWSVDGSQIAFIARRRSVGGRLTPTLVIRSVKTRLEREMKLDAQNLAYPVFSPDGRKLLVVRYTAGRQAAMLIDHGTGEIQQIAATSEERETLVGPGGPTTAPSWSADGKTVYYRRLTLRGFRLYGFDIGTRTHREMFAGGDPAGNVVVLPDGASLVYRRLSGPANAPLNRQHAAFVRRDLTTGQERELYTRFSLGAVNLSPDGRYITTGSVNEGNNQRTILLISVEDGTTREVLSTPMRAGEGNLSGTRNPIIPMGWAPDSRSLLIRRRPLSGPAEIWWAPIDGREPKLLLTGPDIARARVNRDGRSVLFAEPSARENTPEELWALERFLPKASSAR